MEETENGLLEFLKTKRTKEELKLCLEILEEFKSCENQMEWMMCNFSTWVKLEQFQDYLRLLTDTELENVDDEQAKEFLNTVKSQTEQIEDLKATVYRLENKIKEYQQLDARNSLLEKREKEVADKECN